MENPTPRRSLPTRTLAALLRPGVGLGLAWLLPTLIGCQTVTPWGDPNRTQSSAATPPKTDSSVAKSEFRRDPTQDQQYNVHLEIGQVFETQQQYEAALGEYQK